MKALKWMVAVGIGAFAATGIAEAADRGQGKTLAQALCVNCHSVEPTDQQAEVTVGIPSFMAIANKEGQSESNLRSFIMNPHPPMPQVQFTTHELDNIVAYILSLKEE